MTFEFATAHRIVFGPGSVSAVAPAARALGRHALLVTGRDSARAGSLVASLHAAGLAVSTAQIPHEPSTDDVVHTTGAAKAAGCDFVIGFGGGAALDAAKAVSALLTNPGELSDYLEVVGRAQPLTHPAVPCIAIPTTAGTGTEVTRNAVLTSTAHRVKVSLRSPHLLPRLAVVDPALTLTLPPAATAASGLDALTQLIEPYVSARANPLADGFCVEGMKRVARSLRRACEEGGDAAAREDMAFGSLCGGLALATAGLGAVHGFANPIGGLFGAPHGAVCAALLPHVMAANVHALRTRQPGHPALARFDAIARLLTGRPQATAADGITWVRELVQALQIPGLRACGATSADTAAIVAAATRASSMKTNPVPLTPDELAAIVERSL
jgi:alcohol dehydrogenase class IV